ncbi:hypothetical protein ABT297_23495 [Dactylosporangium sp. NPDC000555]|uniref:hypothetical protein n=1 Tax=Dactylosporangium sp. NPDC000555 TaxID=3154260 RepID=UPI003329AE1F
MSNRRFLLQQAVTRVVNRAVGLAHRLIGFGAAPADGPAEADAEPFCRTGAHDAPMWAELATELQLRRIAVRAAR